MSAIVACVDGTRRSLCAVEWAAQEAVRRGFRLRLACTVPGPPTLLDDAVALARERGPQVVVETDHSGGMLERADAAMIVLGGRDSANVPGAVPLIIVWEPPPSDRGEVAVVVDEPAIDAPATSFAFGEATLRKARLRMIQIWPYPVHRRPDEAARSQWRERFSGVEVLSDIVHGDPAQVLAEAGTHADLLVAGAGHGLALPDRLGCPLALVPDAPAGDHYDVSPRPAMTDGSGGR